MFSEWVRWILSWFGLDSLVELDATLLLVGLDNAGKTTILNLLKYDRLAAHAPTMHPTMEEMTVQGINFKAWDLGGHEQARRVWKEYYATADGIVFVCDTTDRERFAEARQQLNHVLIDENVHDVPILVLGNKIDVGGAATEGELREALNLARDQPSTDTTIRQHIRPIDVFMCSAKERYGFKEAFEKFAHNIRLLSSLRQHR